MSLDSPMQRLRFVSVQFLRSAFVFNKSKFAKFLILDFLHESKALTLNPSLKFGRGTLNLASLLPILEKRLGDVARFPQGSRLLNSGSRLLNSGSRLLNSGSRLLNSGNHQEFT
ncbi:MAG: hypothetical protein V7L29_09370 [Nostoc sp.]